MFAWFGETIDKGVSCPKERLSQDIAEFRVMLSVIWKLYLQPQA